MFMYKEEGLAVNGVILNELHNMQVLQAPRNHKPVGCRKVLVIDRIKHFVHCDNNEKQIPKIIFTIKFLRIKSCQMLDSVFRISGPTTQHEWYDGLWEKLGQSFQ